MRQLIKSIVIFLSAFASVECYASKDPCPEVTEESLAGVWEAVYTADNIRIFRLEFNPGGRSVLSQGIQVGPSKSVSLVSELQRKTVAGGKFRLLFSNKQKPIDIFVKGQRYTTTGEDLLSGSGRVCGQEGGTLDAELVMEPNSPDPTVWKLRFIKSVDGVSLAELLMILHKAAVPATPKSR